MEATTRQSIIYPLMFAMVLLTGCQNLLPYEVPEGGRIFRCSQIAGQSSGLPTATARVDTCQCYQMGEALQGTIDIEMQGCKVKYSGVAQ